MTEPQTIYKLMILYMLQQVKFPLTNSQMLKFFLDKEYTNYFTFQQALNELETSGLIHSETIHNTSRYEITIEGSETLSYFIHGLSEGIITDIDQFLKDNKVQMRDESGVIADYYKSTSHDYIVHCQVREGKNIIFSIELSVPSVEQAEIICNNWNKKNQEIYSFAMTQLLAD
jgi:hypothetical protein